MVEHGSAPFQKREREGPGHSGGSGLCPDLPVGVEPVEEEEREGTALWRRWNLQTWTHHVFLRW